MCIIHSLEALNPPFKNICKKYLYYSLRFLEESASPTPVLLVVVGRVGVSGQK